MVEPSSLLPPAWPPPWAVAYGDDPCGLWAEFCLGDVRQRMRWIRPGTFWMGSPDEEPGRLDREGPRHRVYISRGCWLADTACSQALWLAVLGGQNPSRFADDLQCPVEQVSWDEVQGFLAALKSHLGPDANPALPTEAEWEYACRAASDTAFAFGPTVTTDQVNIDGTREYAGSKPGIYRQRTVPVKALPANRWGLYQAHGNVWEWCADGHRNFGAMTTQAEPVADPVGPQDEAPDAHRAVRGGSWLDDARFARSAGRYAAQRSDRYGDLGFRLALRS
jgi:formylglycine-generating enzyme required for sulfatase activity